MRLNRLQHHVNMRAPDKALLTLAGEGQTVHMADAYKAVMADLKGLPDCCRHLTIDLAAVTYMDSSAALMVLHAERWVATRGISVTVLGTEFQTSYMQEIRELQKRTVGGSPALKPFTMTDILARLGAGSRAGLKHVMRRLNLLGGVLRTLVTQPWRWTAISHHVESVGVQALPIIGLVSLLIGAVLAYQGITQLKRFGAEIYTVDFLTISVLREIAVLMTSIVVAGRSGSAFAAQIGTMALTQELDAMRVLGISPLAALVAPRMIALLIALPLLVFFATLMALVGGMIITGLVIDLPYAEFWTIFKQTLSPSTFWVGISKAPIFAAVIALIGCQRGLQVRGSSESVGKMTTRAVVDAIFLVIVLDALLSILFSMMGV